MQEKIEKIREKEKGITLIALVITIIVLLILAGVTIATLTGDNGVLTKATEAKKSNEEAAALEKIKVEVLGSYNQEGKLDINELNNNLKRITGFKYEDKELSDSNKIEKLPALVELDNNSYLIKSDGTTIPTNSQPLECLTSNNYGDYIDLGKNIILNNSSDDDWRLLYNDTENNVIYAILADYLPSENEAVSSSGLTKCNGTTYNVNAGPRQKLIDILDSTTAWQSLITDKLSSTCQVQVKGATTADIILKSYNKKYNAEPSKVLSNSTYFYIENDSTKGIDTLYMPHPKDSEYDRCAGYWLSTPAENRDTLWSVWHQGGFRERAYYIGNEGVRPVVALPPDIQATKTTSNGKTVWTVIQ